MEKKRKYILGLIILLVIAIVIKVFIKEKPISNHEYKIANKNNRQTLPLGPDDIDKMVDNFFVIRYKYTTKISSNKEDPSVTADRAEEELKSEIPANIKIRDKQLENCFIQYIKEKVYTNNRTKIEQEIIEKKIKKNKMEDGDKVIVDINIYTESLFSKQGVKDSKPAYESGNYKFVFDKKTGDLLEYLPEDTEERIFMEEYLKKNS